MKTDSTRVHFLPWCLYEHRPKGTGDSPNNLICFVTPLLTPPSQVSIMMQYFKRPWMIHSFIDQMVKCNVSVAGVVVVSVPRDMGLGGLKRDDQPRSSKI